MRAYLYCPTTTVGIVGTIEAGCGRLVSNSFLPRAIHTAIQKKPVRIPPRPAFLLYA